ncbi:MAG: hypothetical protein ACYS9X_28665, partial [Planctomycetota bacterium]
MLRQKKWDAFDKWMTRRRRWRLAPTAAADLEALAAMRKAVDEQREWTLAAVAKMAAEPELPKEKIARARKMLDGIERLVGAE